MKAIFAGIVAMLVVASVHALGGRRDIDVERPEVQKAALAAARDLTMMMNNPHHQLLQKVHKAQMQVVAGIMYHLQVEIRESGCDKKAPLASCDAAPTNMYQVCSVKVLSQAWRHVLKVVGGWATTRCHPVYH